MTIVHRIFTPDFARRTEVNHWGTRINQGTRVTDAPTGGASSGITSTPWEGLYVETEGDVENPVAGALAKDPDLETFLAGLMYGE